MEKITWPTNEQVLQRIGEKRTLLNNIFYRKVYWTAHILRRNCLLYDAFDGNERSRKKKKKKKKKNTAS